MKTVTGDKTLTRCKLALFIHHLLHNINRLSCWTRRALSLEDFKVNNW